MCGHAPVEITKCCDVVDGGGRLEERTGQVPGGGFLLFQRSWLCERSCRSAEANDPDQVLETAASGPLLCTTDDERLEAYAPADDERSYAGRPPQLVSAHRDEVGAERIEVDGDVTNRCGSIDVHEHTRRPAARHDLGHRLQRPDLVVEPLAVHQRRPTAGITSEQRCEMVEIYAARRAHFEHENRTVAPGRLAHAGMLDIRADHRRTAVGPARREDRRVGCFCGATGEHDTARSGSHQQRHGLSCTLDRVAHEVALGMYATRVTGPASN